MKIVFMGTPSFAEVVFENLVARHQILAIFTQPDKPVGRKNIITPPLIKIVALKHSVPVFQPKKIDESQAESIRKMRPDVIVVVAYGKILPESILNIAPCINVHASILPKYRGASPIQQMILSDDEEFGVSIMQMSYALDSGDILKIKTMPREDIGLESLSKKLALLGADALLKTLENLHSIKPIPQDESKATYCKKILKSDGLICFDNAKAIFKKSLAYEKWPGIYLESGLKLFDIGLQDENSKNMTGEILGIEKDYIVIGCGQGSLKIGQLQAPNKQKVCAKDFICGRGYKIGDILK